MSSVIPKPPPRGPVAEEIAAALERSLDDPTRILDQLVAEVAKGRAHPDLWQRLHEAAAAQGRHAELATAYGTLVDGRKLKALSPLYQADVVLRAADFYADVLDEPELARRSLEGLLQMEQLRGPRRIEAQKRLAKIRLGISRDAQTLALFEGVVAVDPSDDEVRRSYVTLAQELERAADAARLLTRALAVSKAPAVRARVGTDLGAVYLALGDGKRARAALGAVLEANGDDGAVLEAARMLRDLYADGGELAALAGVLERLGQLEPDEVDRTAALEQLAHLCATELGEPGRAAIAFRAMFGTPREDAALEALEAIYEQSEAFGELCEILERRAERAASPEVGRALAVRAAELYTTRLGDRAGAIAAWSRVLAGFGPERGVHAVLLPLLEQEKRYGELAAVLESEINLAPQEERAPLWGKLAGVRLNRLKDTPGAVEAAGHALALDPGDRASLFIAEVLLSAPETALAAADLLEPVYRGQGITDGVMRVLAARAAAEPAIGARLAALEEAFSLAGDDLPRVLGRGVRRPAAAPSGAPPPARGGRAGGVGGAAPPAARAAILVEALGTREIDHRSLMQLAAEAGEALAHGGDPERGLVLLRRALSFDPAAPELLDRVLELLRQSGRTEDRLALLRRALERSAEPARRAAALHRIGAIERGELGDPRAAIATYRRALDEDPDDAAARDALIEACTAAGELEPLYDELARGLGRTEGAARRALLSRMAGVAAAAGHADRAEQHYAEILAAEAPLDAALLEPIERFADSRNDARLLLEALGHRVRGAADGAARAGWLERVGDELAARAGDAAGAVAAYKEAAELVRGDRAFETRLFERVLALAPDDRDALVAVVAAYREDGARYPELAAAFERLARQPLDDGALLGLLLSMEAPAAQAGDGPRIAAAVERALGERPSLSAADAAALLGARARLLAAGPATQDAAAAAYRELVERAPDEAPAVAAFEAFLAASPPTDARREDLRWLMSRRADDAAPADRARALLAWAAAEETTFGDREAAIALYRRATEADPDLDDAHASVARLLGELGDAAGAAAAIEARRARAEGARRARLDLELAELYAQRLDRPDDALALVEGVLASDAEQAPALALAERILLAAQGAMPGAARAAWFGRLVAHRAADPAAALEIALAAVAQLPGERSLWDAVETHGAAAKEQARVAGAYARALDAELGTETRRELGVRAVELHDEWLDDGEGVIRLLESVVAHDGGAGWAFDRLKLTYSSSERWGELLALLDRAIAAAPGDAERLDLYGDAAQVARDFAGDAERAIGYLERLLPLAPDDRRTRSSLERLYEASGRFAALIDLLAAELPSAEIGEAQRQRARMASLWMRLGDAEQAFAVIEQMLAIDPDRAEAYELLERIFTSPSLGAAEPPLFSGVPGGSVPPPSVPLSVRDPGKAATVRQRAAALLKPRYAAAGRARELVRILELEVQAAASTEERIRRYGELFTLYEDTLGDPGGALEALAALVVLEPERDDRRRRFADLAAGLDRFDRLAAVLTKAADRTEDATLRARLLADAARVSRDRLGAEPRAIDLYQRALSSQIADRDLELEVARALDPLLASAGRTVERCEVLDRLADIETDPGARRAALGEVARIATVDFQDADRAIRAWRARLEDDPGDLTALDGLREALLALGRWRDAIEVIEMRARAPGTPDEERSGWLRRAAEMSEERLGDVEGASRIYKDLLARAPADLAAMEDLGRLLRQQARFGELCELRRRQIAILGDAAARSALRLELATLLEDAGDGDAVIAVLTENLADAPTDETTVARLGDLYAARGMHRARLTLWEEQAERRETGGDAAGAAGLWTRAAVLAEDKLGDKERAIADHQRAATHGETTSLAALERLHLERHDYAAAAVALEALLACAPREEKGATALRLAAALADAGRKDLALERVEHTAAELPDDAEVHARLVALYREGERWASLAELFARDAEREPTAAGKIARLREAAELHLARRGDPAAAIPLLERAAELAPDDAPIRLTVCQALREVGRPEDAARSLRALVERYGTRRPKERALVHAELGRAVLAAGDRAGALAELDAATKIDPTHLGIRHLYADVALEDGQLDVAQRMYRALLMVLPRPKHAETPALSRAEVLLRLADIAERQGAAASAAESIESAFAAAAESDGERAWLERELRSRGRWDLLARAIEARLSAIVDPAAAAALYDELASIHERHGRVDDAVAARLAAVARAPASAALHDAALALCRSAGKLSSYVDAVSRLADAAAGRELAYDLFLFLGRALEDEVRDDARAAGVYRRAERAAAELAAGDLAGRRADEVSRALERVYNRLGDAEASAQVLEARIAAMAERPLAAAERADVIYRLAALRLGAAATREAGAALLEQAMEVDPQPERALALSAAAAEAPPPNERTVRLFERLARAEGEASALLRALVLASDFAPTETAGLREAAGLALEAGDRKLAQDLSRRILARATEASLGDDAGWALTTLAALRQEEGDLREAATLKERAAEIADAPERRTLLLDVAALAAGPLGDLPLAARLFGALHEEDPADRTTWEPLLDVYRRLGDGARLAELIEATLPLVDTVAERSRLRLELVAELERAGDGGGERVTELLRDVCDEDPAQLGAAMKLGDRLELAGRTEDLTELVGRQLDLAKDRSEVAAVVRLSIRLGALYEAAGREPDALDVYYACLDWDAAAKDALRGVARLLEKRDDPAELADALEKLCGVEVGAEAARLAARLAALRSSQGDPEGAERALALGFRADPKDRELFAQLESQYTAREAWRELAELYAADEARHEAAADRASCVQRGAEVLERAGVEPELAFELRARAPALVPADRGGLLALAAAAGPAGAEARALELVDAAVAAGDLSADVLRARAGLREAAGDLAGAVDDMERAASTAAGSLDEDLAALLERAAARASGADERRLRVRLAELHAARGDVDGAARELQAALDGDPDDRAALAARAALEAGAGRWDEAIAGYRRLAELGEGLARVEATLRVAEVCEAAGRAADARPDLEEARRLGPPSLEVLRRLRGLCEQAGEHEALAELHLEEAGTSEDPAAQYEALLAAARLWLDAGGGGPARAIRVLEDARTLRPDEQEPMLLLSDALALEGHAADAMALLTQAAAGHKRRGKPLAAIHLRIARILAAEGNARGALDALVKAFDNDGHNGALAMEVGAAAMDLGDYDVASRVLRAATLMRVTGAEGEGTTREAKALAYYQLGVIAQLEGDAKKARMMAEKALVEDPSLGEAQALLDQVR